MREIDQNAIKARNDADYFEVFLTDYEGFILNTARKATGRYIAKTDDRWSVAMSAFHEAVSSYAFEKGAFLPFADTVIKRRLYDYLRKQSKHSCEVLIDSYTAEAVTEDDLQVKYEVMAKTATKPESEARLEIEVISNTLKDYGITFTELAGVSPKAIKTKKVCGKAISFLTQNPLLINEMKRTKALPLKVLEKNANLPRKVLERHRKYIIAGAEIISGDYPILSEYLRFVREEKWK